MTTEVRMTSPTGAEKGSKQARFDLIPAGPLTKLAELYGRGAEKYADRNWEAGYDWSLSFAALQRHAWQFWGGEDYDEETGAPHLASVAWHAFALLQYMEQHPEFDNRATVPDPVPAMTITNPAIVFDSPPVRRTWDLISNIPQRGVYAVRDRQGDVYRFDPNRGWEYTFTERPGDHYYPITDLNDADWSYYAPFTEVFPQEEV